MSSLKGQLVRNPNTHERAEVLAEYGEWLELAILPDAHNPARRRWTGLRDGWVPESLIDSDDKDNLGMYWRNVTDTDTVTSVLPAGGERYYLVNGEPTWWKASDDPRSYGEKYEALAALAARDTSRPDDERERAAAEYRRLAGLTAGDRGGEVPEEDG